MRQLYSILPTDPCPSMPCGSDASCFSVTPPHGPYPSRHSWSLGYPSLVKLVTRKIVIILALFGLGDPQRSLSSYMLFLKSSEMIGLMTHSRIGCRN